MYYFMKVDASDECSIMCMPRTCHESRLQMCEINFEMTSNDRDELSREAVIMKSASKRLCSFQHYRFEEYEYYYTYLYFNLSLNQIYYVNRTNIMLLFTKLRKYEADEVIALASLGFFIPSTSSLVDYSLLKCSLCLRSFMYGARLDALRPYSTMEHRTTRLVWRHSVMCPTCPLTLGIFQENQLSLDQSQRKSIYKYFSLQVPEQCLLSLSKIPIESLLYRNIQPQTHLANATAEIDQHKLRLEGDPPITSFDSLRYRSAYGEAGMQAFIPEIDDDSFFHYRAEFEVDPYAEFNSLEFMLSEDFISEDLKSLQVIDFMIAIEPKRKDLCSLERREKTFTEFSWTSHVSFTKPTCEQIAKAGFYYTGDSNKVHCFWCFCSIHINGSDDEDDSWRDHAIRSPLCPWIYRCRGHFFVGNLLMQNRGTNDFDNKQKSTSLDETFGTLGSKIFLMYYLVVFIFYFMLILY